MIKIFLPKSMGRIVSRDPHTFAPNWVHPILDIGRDYTYLKDEIREWLLENVGFVEFEYNKNVEPPQHTLVFNNEQEVTMFMLRWR